MQVSGTNLLEEMINDGNRWLTTFQLYSSKTRWEVCVCVIGREKERERDRDTHKERKIERQSTFNYTFPKPGTVRHGDRETKIDR